MLNKNLPFSLISQMTLSVSTVFSFRVRTTTCEVSAPDSKVLSGGDNDTCSNGIMEICNRDAGERRATSASSIYLPMMIAPRGGPGKSLRRIGYDESKTVPWGRLR